MTISNEHTELNPEPIEPSAAADATGSVIATLPEGATDAASETATTEATPGIEIGEAKRALEAALMAASEPMPLSELKRLFDGELSSDILRNLLDELREEWTGRSVELALVASGYRYRVKPEYQKYLDKLTNDKPPKYSRAVLETLAIIAYRQPVTRAGVAAYSQNYAGSRLDRRNRSQGSRWPPCAVCDDTAFPR
ncbi:MAG: SMC-Scp complex subunit ScpB [Usitatibacteraceae bacterium]